jgi:hypothetical protein
MWHMYDIDNMLNAPAGDLRLCCTVYIPYAVNKGLIHGLNNYKTPNPKCRLYWCLIEFIDWRYSQWGWYFRPALWTIAPLTFSLVSSPPPFPVNKYDIWQCFLSVYSFYGLIQLCRVQGVKRCWWMDSMLLKFSNKTTRICTGTASSTNVLCGESS